jgi:hypothetical protein
MHAPQWLEPIGVLKFASALRKDPSGCGSVDHPKMARTAEGGACSKSPVWFRLGRLRPQQHFSEALYAELAAVVPKRLRKDAFLTPA